MITCGQWHMWDNCFDLQKIPIAEELIDFLLCRKDVVSLPHGLFANVLLVWETVCRSNHTDSFIFEKRAFYCPLS